jgi:hypothetical protein
MIEYERHSPSSLNLFAASPAMFVLERILGLKQPVGSPAHRGVAVEEGVTFGLMDLKAPVAACINAALVKYDTITAFSPDPRKDQYRATVAPMVTSALKELRDYGKPSTTQGFVTWQPEDLRLPIVGYFDYEWSKHGILGDLKTTERMPSQIKTGHARQVALYAASDNIDARLIYCTPKRLEVYGLENVRKHRDALHRIALAVEKFIALSDDPEFFKTITVPDLDSFYWANPPARQLAYEIWGV